MCNSTDDDCSFLFHCFLFHCSFHSTQDGILAYQTKEVGGTIKGQLLIADCLVTVQEGGLGFAVTVPGRTMRCKCATKQDAAKWIAVLRGEKEPNNVAVEEGGPPLPSRNGSGETKSGGSGGSGGGGGGNKKKNTKPALVFGDEEQEVLDEKSSTTLIKSTSTTGNVLKFEVAHRHPREIYFTIDITGSTNLKLKDSLAGKRTQTVKSEWLTRVGLVTVMDPLKGWSLKVKYSWEVKMAP